MASTILAGILSCAVILQADVWWNKGSAYSENVVSISSLINRTSNQLIISDAEVIPILSLSHRINSNAKIFLPSQLSSINELSNLNDFDSIYLFQPSSQLRSFLEQQAASYRIDALYPQTNPILWQITTIK